MRNSLADAAFWAAVASCAVAQVAIVRSVVLAPKRRAIELAWAVLPALGLGAALVMTWRRMHP